MRPPALTAAAVHGHPSLPLAEGDPIWGPVGAGELPPLRGSARCEVGVVGAGAVGLSLALDLRQRGLAPVVLEAGRVGAGSTATSTALLLWETDLDFRRLARRLGTAAAARVWKGCLGALDWIEGHAGRLGFRSFRRAWSVYYAETEEDVPPLLEEAQARVGVGLPSRFVQDPRPWLGFEAPGAIVSAKAGTLDPARFLEELLAACLERGVVVHERTPLRRASPRCGGQVLLVGGEDLPPALARRARGKTFVRLRSRVSGLYPELATAPERARWSGLFPNSSDGLPFLGSLPVIDGADVVLAFGGNGLVFGFLGASLLARSYAGEDVKDELSLYGYDRLSLAERARLRIEDALA